MSDSVSSSTASEKLKEVAAPDALVRIAGSGARANKLEALRDRITDLLGARVRRMVIERDELELVVGVGDYLSAARDLKQDAACQFEQLIDLCGIDYFDYKKALNVTVAPGQRFCVAVQLLSVSLNQRLRLKVFAPDDDWPVVPSLMDIWSSSNWFEREAFDLFGIVFDGHSDLRRILTDYGFIGHPFRKDFPTSGHVEMRYDEQLQRVIYQPVTIAPREITPRIIREEGYGGVGSRGTGVPTHG